MITISASFF